ncbi:MAG: porin [Xanthobacteraceae bacterium]
MKMVKSLLLGSAAGLMAVAGAQAADLPVKAAPVEYVKICSLYGAGFYYIPGTDTCVKIGGWVRFEAVTGAENPSNTPFYGSLAGTQNTRLWTSMDDIAYRARATISMDTRAQTEWGTVRTYMNIGWTAQNKIGLVDRGFGGPTLYTNRAFIQWAGFTFGRAQSFYDLIPQSSFMYWNAPSHDTGDQATLLAAYTTQWGNGISTTLSAEYPRRAGVFNVDAPITGGVAFNGTSYNIGPFWYNDYVNIQVPDIVGNFRIDQAWGSFQVMSALHQVGAAYYATPCAVVGATITGAQNCGHPDDKWGWAAGVGAVINMPFFARGRSRLAFRVNFSEGASVYVNNNGDPTWWGGSYSVGTGWLSDAILRDNVPGVQAGSLELTKAWGFVAAFEHFWTPSLRTSWYGGGYQVDHNANATNYICSVTSLANNPNGAVAINNPLCDPDHAVWYVGSRTQWNIRPDFYMGVDVLYSTLDPAHNGAWASLGANGARPASLPNYKFEDQDNLAVRFRVQRDIVP